MGLQRVGLLGVGLVGTAIARRMLEAGFEVVGFDIDAQRLAVMESLGGMNAGSVRGVFAASTQVILSLPDSDCVAEVLGQASDTVQRGSVLIDTTTGTPQEAVKQSEAWAKVGVDYGDATILGSSAQVAAGDALVIAGGSSSFFEVCQRISAPWAKETVHVGPAGSGAKLKLVVNHVLGLQRLVLAEGLGLAQSAGIDLGLALDILRKGPTASVVLETKGPQMLQGDYQPRARLRQHLKDVTLIQSLGEQCGARLPLENLHRTLLEEAVANGWGDLDNSAVFRLFAEKPQPAAK